MTFKEFLYYCNLIFPILTGLGCFVFSIWNIFLCAKNRKLKNKLDSVKYWIAAIDKDELIKVSSHDVRYLNEARKILNED